MADLYNHYKGVEPGSITGATSSLRTKVTQIRTKLGTLKSSLSDDVWKAGAKATLLEAFEKIDGEVCEDIIKKLDNADKIAEYVQTYNEAKANAEEYSNKLSSSNSDTEQSSIDTWREGLKSEEDIMRDCVSNISGLL